MECVTPTSYSISLNSTRPRQKGFRYHKWCKDLGITHLIFVDDMFRVSVVDQKSLGLIKSVIVECGDLVTLKSNFQKSSMFITG